jgi:hypothetical protein
MQAAGGPLHTLRGRRLVGRGGLCRSGEDREALADGVEEREPERRFVGPITRPSPRRFDGGEVCRLGVAPPRPSWGRKQR